MNTFQLEIGTLVTYDGIEVHDEGKVIGIDFYSKIENSNVVKTWTSYSITSSPNLAVETQMKRGDRWWITWDGSNLREWIYATEDNVDLSGKIVEAVTGDIAVKFEGDSGVSTSQGQLFVYQTKGNSDIWHAREEFCTVSGSKEVIHFLSKPIYDIDEITILGMV
jgi:hypothetical protein